MFETFSKRQKKAEKKDKVPYEYDDIPKAFRIQVIHILSDAMGFFVPVNDFTYEVPRSNRIWDFLCKTMCREKGVRHLGNAHSDIKEQCEQFIENGSRDDVLDIVELAFTLINDEIREFSVYDKSHSGISQNADDAIKVLNHRFQEHNLGYQFIDHQLIKISSEYLQANVVVPALTLLRDSQFSGPEQEFLNAHEHCLKGRDKEAISEALKAFESTMMAICDRHHWKYPNNATAKALIDLLIANGIIPKELEAHFNNLRAAMEGGLPTVRNKKGGHGQGAVPKPVPRYFTFYALHLAAANIVFLVEASTSLIGSSKTDKA